jgi:hypothetical protein
VTLKRTRAGDASLALGAALPTLHTALAAATLEEDDEAATKDIEDQAAGVKAALETWLKRAAVGNVAGPAGGGGGGGRVGAARAMAFKRGVFFMMGAGERPDRRLKQGGMLVSGMLGNKGQRKLGKGGGGEPTQCVSHAFSVLAMSCVLFWDWRALFT